MPIDEKLRDILVCPETKQPLIYFEDEQFLFSPAAMLKFPIDDGIPVMLIDEADEVDRDEGESLLEEAREKGLDNADQSLGG